MIKPLSQIAAKRRAEAIPLIQRWSAQHEGRFPHTLAASIAANVYAGHILFDVDRDKWLFWNGQIWTTEHSAQIVTGLVMTLIHEVIIPNLQGAPSPYMLNSMLNYDYPNSIIKAMRLTKR